MRLVQADKLSSSIGDLASKQIDTFIEALRNARTAEAQSFDNIKPIPLKEPGKLQTIPTAKQNLIKGNFPSSKNSKIFHLPGCASVKTIKPGNLEAYQTREKAIKAGKRPCKRCKP